MTDQYDDTPRLKEISAEILLLSCGLIFLIGSACVSSDFLDSVANLLDVRQWNGFMITTAILNAIIIIYWFVVRRLSADDTFDEESLIYVRAFIPSTSIVFVESCLGFYLSTTEFPRYAGYQLRLLFCNGVYSHSGLALAFGITTLLVVNSIIIIRDVRTYLNYWVQ